jgi:hypothetical protein
MNKENLRGQSITDLGKFLIAEFEAIENPVMYDEDMLDFLRLGKGYTFTVSTPQGLTEEKE